MGHDTKWEDLSSLDLKERLIIHIPKIDAQLPILVTLSSIK